MSEIVCKNLVIKLERVKVEKDSTDQSDSEELKVESLLVSVKEEIHESDESDDYDVNEDSMGSEYDPLGDRTEKVKKPKTLKIDEDKKRRSTKAIKKRGRLHTYPIEIKEKRPVGRPRKEKEPAPPKAKKMRKEVSLKKTETPEFDDGVTLNSEGCELCMKGFEDVNDLREHLRSHTVTITERVRSCVCTLCPESFNSTKDLSRHITDVHPDAKPFRCSLCDYSSNQEKLLKKHMISHSNIRTYLCSVCSLTFKRKHSLDIHMNKHDPTKTFKCKLCDESFSSAKSLRKHKEVHAVNRTVYQCELCPAALYRIKDLQTHITIQHSSISEPVNCVLCNHQTSDKYSRKLHMLQHDGERVYNCHLCRFMCLASKDLETHRESHLQSFTLQLPPNS